jgi:hypothetical protein
MPGADTIQVILQVGECLAWALPAPFGPLGAGGLTFIDALYMSDSSGKSKSGLTADEMSEFLQSAVEKIEKYIQALMTARDREDIAAFSRWLSTEQAVLAAIGDNAPYIEEMLEVLNRMTTPGSGTLLNALMHIEAAYNRFVREDLNSFREWLVLFDTFLVAISTVIFATRMKVLLASKLTSIYTKNGLTKRAETANDRWLGYYAELVFLIRGDGKGKLGLPDKANACWSVIPTEIEPLLARIAEKEKLYPRIVFAPDCDVLSEEFLHSPGSLDRFLLDPQNAGLWKKVYSRAECLAFVNSFPPSSYSPMPRNRCPPDEWPFLLEYYGRVERVPNIIDKWRSAGGDWYDHRPPLVPNEVAQVHEPWGGTVPKLPNWVENNAVAYAVVYQNSHGRSPRGPFCDWIEIKDQAFPTVTVRADPLGMATKILVYRKFRATEDKHSLIKELVGGELQFQDNTA